MTYYRSQENLCSVLFSKVSNTKDYKRDLFSKFAHINFLMLVSMRQVSKTDVLIKIEKMQF